jgi:uncharacterized protein
MKPVFDEHEVLHELKHFLPAQAPLKDFIHHNTLHSFQNLRFGEAIRRASEIFGYKGSLSLEEYRELYHSNRIRKDVLDNVLARRKGVENTDRWLKTMLTSSYDKPSLPRIGSLRAQWKRQYFIDLDSLVHPILFRTLCSYLDQGIAMWNFPATQRSFLDSLREMERTSFTSFFKGERARSLFLTSECKISNLLKIVVGDELLFKQYLFDMQFSHQGWSGIVSIIEDQPQTLIDQRSISLHDLIVFELLLEIDALDYHFKRNWSSLSSRLSKRPIALFADVPVSEESEVLSLWQEAFEWSYYDQVLAGIQLNDTIPSQKASVKNFQALFCIDDRECSLRRYLEKIDHSCETFGTPGFFGVEFFFQPDQGKFYTKLCPAPVTPQFLIKENGVKSKRDKDAHFAKQSHSLFRGWLITQTLGFWSALKLFINIFRPSMSPATASSFKHMDKTSSLTIENTNVGDVENGLQIGFTVEEMVTRVESLLKSIGLVQDFAPVVYVMGHGSSSVNNPHFAAYDCGACSGRPGSVNARVICHMANHAKVRELLKDKGVVIPTTTQFVGGLHDTTRDEVVFFDESSLTAENLEKHVKNVLTFNQALDYNAKERSRRFESINTQLSPHEIHGRILIRSVSLFEPRPELNHATNALCIVGRRELTRGLFLDRRSFLNSYNYAIDPDGKYLFNILKAAAPVCGGINLEYYFSRVDNQKLGAGTKLPHNVMGLFGVANGIDGDLRPGLPSQMTEVHDPVRLLIIVEHFNNIVLQTIQKSPETYEWFINEWVNLAVVHPETKAISVLENGAFVPYSPVAKKLDHVADLDELLESSQDNFPVYLLSQN